MGVSISDGERDYFIRVAQLATCVAEYLAFPINDHSSLLFTNAVCNLERALNPKCLPFDDRERRSHGGDVELCRGWSLIREITDEILTHCKLEECAQNSRLSWTDHKIPKKDRAVMESRGVAVVEHLPVIPEEAPERWRRWFSSGITLIVRRLKATEPPPGYPNYERDKFIFETWCRDGNWKVIAAEVVKRLGWEPLTERGCANAAEIYAKHIGAELPKRKKGRQPKTNNMQS